MSLGGVDKDYAECCKGYLRDWIKKYDAEKYLISEAVLDEIIAAGGEGLRELQMNFTKLIDHAKEECVEIIDEAFVKQVFSH